MSEREQPEPEQKFQFTRAAVALLRFAQLDLRAITLFENSPQAAWSAQKLLLLCIPVLMLVSLYDPALPQVQQQLGFTPLAYGLLVVTHFLISAYGFMLLVHHLGQKLGFNKTFPLYVNAQFSIAFPMVIFAACLTLLWRALGVTETSEALLQVVLYGVQITIDWMITYSALRVKPLVAFGISVMGVLFAKIAQYFILLIIMLTIAPSVVATP